MIPARGSLLRRSGRSVAPSASLHHFPRRLGLSEVISASYGVRAISPPVTPSYPPPLGLLQVRGGCGAPWTSRASFDGPRGSPFSFLAVGLFPEPRADHSRRWEKKIKNLPIFLQ